MGNYRVKKSILKKIGSFVLGAYLVLGSIGLLTFGGVFAREKIATSKYITSSSITESLSDLDIENPYIIQDSDGLYQRFANNGKEPIYISFDEKYESMPRYKEIARESLDYVFGLLNEINPKYTYKIVSESERKQREFFGKSTIQYIYEDFDSTGRSLINGEAQRRPTYFDFLVWDNIINRYNVSMHFGHLDTFEDEYVRYIYIHELLHVFGFKDVYETYRQDGRIVIDGKSRYRADTFMQSKFGKDMQMITPKDYATLCALYTPKVSDEKKADEKLRIEKLIEDYTTNYYNVVNDKACEYIGDKRSVEKEKIKPGDVDSEIKFKRILFLDYNIDTKEYTIVQNIYHVTINGDQYTLKLYDEDKKLLDTCSGKVIKTDNFLILENCNFKHGCWPNVEKLRYDEDFITNIMFYDCGEGLSGYVEQAQSIVYSDMFINSEDEASLSGTFLG